MSFLLQHLTAEEQQPACEEAQGSLLSNKLGGARALGDQVHSGWG